MSRSEYLTNLKEENPGFVKQVRMKCDLREVALDRIASSVYTGGKWSNAIRKIAQTARMHIRIESIK